MKEYTQEELETIYLKTLYIIKDPDRPTLKICKQCGDIHTTHYSGNSFNISIDYGYFCSKFDYQKFWSKIYKLCPKCLEVHKLLPYEYDNNKDEVNEKF